MIRGRAVGLHLITLLLPGNDDLAGVPAGVDDSAEVPCGAVVEVARLMLVLFWYMLPARGTLGISEFLLLFLDVFFIFDLRVSHSVESINRYNVMGECPSCVCVTPDL
jgi:hypothetical protein